ncbi:hypothetical protein [Porticoccus sp.]
MRLTTEEREWLREVGAQAPPTQERETIKNGDTITQAGIDYVVVGKIPSPHTSRQALVYFKPLGYGPLEDMDFYRATLTTELGGEPTLSHIRWETRHDDTYVIDTIGWWCDDDTCCPADGCCERCCVFQVEHYGPADPFTDDMVIGSGY